MAMLRDQGYAPFSDGGAIQPYAARPVDGVAPFRVTPGTGLTQSLSTLIESEIIPRLMVVHGGGVAVAAYPDAGRSIGHDEVEALAPLTMQVEADALLNHVESFLARGVAADTVMVDLLAPTARLLGEMWEDDRCDFVDVTMGLWRLQEVVHEIAARYPSERRHVPGGHRALFAAMPGDQHNFGTVVIDEVFRRDGWLTERLTEAATPDLVKRVADHWFDLVGLTISCDCHIAAAASIVAALRNVSRNPRLCIMVGGRVFTANPALAAEIGADGTARDAKLALQLAYDLVRERAWEMAG